MPISALNVVAIHDRRHTNVSEQTTLLAALRLLQPMLRPRSHDW